MDDNEERDKIVADNIPGYWDTSHYEWVLKIRDLAKTLPGVKITGSGTSADTADFSFEANGKHYWVFIRSIGGKPS